MNKNILSFSAYLILFLSHFSIVAETSPAMEMEVEVETPSKILKRSACDSLVEMIPSKKANLRSSLTMRRLSTQQDHRDFLKESILTAKNDILITSYGVDNAGLGIGEIYSLLAAARDRGVKVTIYK